MPVLAYWKLRGLAHPIRLLLNYVGEDFEDKYYVFGDAPEYSKECWLEEKFSYGLDFPNLPYYIDGDVKLTQSNAIMRYISKKHNLEGSTEREKIRVDLMADESAEFRTGLVRLSYNPDFANLKADYLKNVRTKVDQFEAFIGGNNFFAGNKLTFVDFIMYDLLDLHRILDPTIFAKSPRLRDFIDRFEALPAIKKYISSNKFFDRPLNGPMATFK